MRVWWLGVCGGWGYRDARTDGVLAAEVPNLKARGGGCQAEAMAHGGGRENHTWNCKFLWVRVSTLKPIVGMVVTTCSKAGDARRRLCVCGGLHLARVQAVEDCCLARVVQAENENAHLQLRNKKDGHGGGRGGRGALRKHCTSFAPLSLAQNLDRRTPMSVCLKRSRREG